MEPLKEIGLGTEEFDDEPTLGVVEPQDIDPGTWLAQDDTHVMGSAVISGKKMAIAALTQGELEDLRKASQKINPRDPKGEKMFDSSLFTRMVVAFSLNKAFGSNVQPEQLKTKLAGDLKHLAERIIELSGLDDKDRELPFD